MATAPISKQIRRRVKSAPHDIIVSLLPADGSNAESVEVNEVGSRTKFRVTVRQLLVMLALRGTAPKRAGFIKKLHQA